MKAALQHLVSFSAPKLRPFVRFVTSQGITLAGNLLYGLLCVRLLPTADYAQFVVLFGFQGSLIVLMDVGISSSLNPLIAERIHDNQLIADYVASLRQIAHRLYLVIGLGLVLIYPYLVRNRQWSWPTIVAMIATLLVSTWFVRVSSAYGTVLIIKRERPRWYQGQMISSFGTLALLLAFWALHRLGAFSAILINVSGIVFTAGFYFWHARKLLQTPGEPTRQKRRAIVSLALPNVPFSIFYALQGQISLLLITYFGRTTSVASIGALGRLSQIFVLFTQMNPLLVEPYFARLPKPKLKTSYFSALFLVIVFSSAVTLFTAFFPEVFLWVLGPKYQNLRREVILVVAAGSVNYISAVLWTIHSARRFVYWWNNITTIILTLITQIAFVSLADLSSVRSLLLLNLVTVSIGMLVNLLSGFWGFAKGPRAVETPAHPFPPEGTLDPEELTGETSLHLLGPEPSD